MGFWNCFLNKIVSLCSGEENKVTVNDLRPATDYHAKWVSPCLVIKFSGNVLKVSLYLSVCINLQRLYLPLLTFLCVTNQCFWLSWPLSPVWKIREDCCALTQHPSSFLHARTVNFFCSLSQAQCCLISLNFPQAAEQSTLHRKVLTAGHLKVALCCFCFAAVD